VCGKTNWRELNSQYSDATIHILFLRFCSASKTFVKQVRARAEHYVYNHLGANNNLFVDEVLALNKWSARLPIFYLL